MIDDLDEDVLSLLREAKVVPELEPATKAKLFADVASRVVVPPPTGGGGGGGPAASSATGLASTKGIAALVATFALGAGAGVAVDRSIAPPAPASPPIVSVVSAPEPAPPVRVPEEPRGVPVTALPSVAAPPRATAPIAPVPSDVSARGLAAERALLDVARGALARGEPKEAFEATQRHVTEYPAGALVEEREAIAIKALVALGRRDEARGRAAEMERRYPNSLLLRAVKAAVERE